MKKVIEWAQKYRAGILLGVAVLIGASAFSYFSLPKDVFPNAVFPRIQVVADIGFGSLEETEIDITRPLEQELNTVAGVTEVRSVTERGTSTIDVYFKWGRDMKEALQQVQTKIDGVRGGLPAGISITAQIMTISSFPMSEYGFYSDTLSQEELFTYVKYSVVPELVGMDGIYGLDLIGGEEPEIWIKLDPAKIERYDLDPDAVADAVDKANRFEFLGKVSRGANEYLAFGGSKLTNAAAIGNIVVDTRMAEPIRLRDIARVVDSHAELRRLVTVNGHKGIIIDVRKQDTADGLKLSREIDAKLQRVAQNSGGTLHVVNWDLSDFVRRSVQGILSDILLGIVLILAIVFLVLKRLHYALPIILILPVVLAVEFLVLKLFGQTMNIMTLGGLSAALGIVADNAVVITEHYLRRRSSIRDGDPIAVSAAEILPPMLWATAVTIVVFVPLNLLSGVSGFFFKPLSITLSTTILLSLLAAVFVTPVLIGMFVDRGKGGHKEERHPAFDFVTDKYLGLLNLTLRGRWAAVAGVVAVSVLAVFLFAKLPSGFLPEWDEGFIVLDYITSPQSSLEATDALMGEVEKIIRTFPDVELIVRKTATHMGTPYAEPNVGEIVLKLRPDRKKSTFEIMDELDAAIRAKYPDLDTDYHQILPDRLGDLTGNVKPVVVNLVGNDMNSILKTAGEVKTALEGIRGLDGVRIDIPPYQDEIKVRVDPEACAFLGLNASDVSRNARYALFGQEVSTVFNGLQSIPVLEVYAGDYREHPSLIGSIPVYNPNGSVVPLSKVAVYSMESNLVQINHKNGSMAVGVTAEISGRALSDVVNDIQTSLSKIRSPGVTLDLEGDYQNQQTSFRELSIVTAVSVAIILLLLLFIFDSFPAALSVFLGTLASAAFVAVGLYLTGTEFDVSSFIGMITVMGIVVNNGILVIRFAEDFRKQGMPVREALNRAGKLRFRPVLITNLAAIAGFVPMALKIGSGGEILYPFSIAMISGLIGSMFFSLIVMPVFYDLFRGRGTAGQTSAG